MGNISRYSPALAPASLQREVDRMFDRFLGRAGWRPEDENLSAVWSPLVDLVETEDSYLIHMDLPGLSAADVNITYENGTLQVSGERQFEKKEEQDAQFHLLERWYGRFHRSFEIGREINPEAIKATFKDGVLEISLAKREESKPVRIKIS